MKIKLNETNSKVLKHYIQTTKEGSGEKENVEIVPIKEIHIIEGNPNKHTKEHISDMIKNLKQNGLMVPILKNTKNELITGEGRIIALKQMNCEYIACLTIENLSPEMLRAYRIADNQLTRSSMFDYSLLKNELTFLYDYKIFGTDLGFTPLKVDQIFNYKIEEQKTTQIKETPKEQLDILSKDITQRVTSGDLWRMGDHFLFCGDSLKPESFSTVMQGELAQIVVTDAPYNVPISGHVCGLGKTKHDEFQMASGEMSNEEFENNFVTPYMKNCLKYSKAGSLHYHFIDWRGLRIFLNVGHNIYDELKNICVWSKTNGGGMGSLYRSQHEMVCVFKNGKEQHINNIELGKNGRYRTNIWEYPGIRANTPETLELLKLHPTVKPIALLHDILLDATNINDIVLDCFGGSGSTLIAATRCKRRARLIEISPHYCDIILWRWEKETNKTATLVRNIGGDKNV